MGDKVTPYVQTPEDICKANVAFVIPSYQRPYVWPDDDVLKLFNDIIDAKDEGEKTYYIGTVLSSLVHPQQDQKNKAFELIDGQQRITTLMLIALAFQAKGVGSLLANLATLDKHPRLTFKIRDQVQSLLGHKAGLSDYQHPGEKAVNSNPYLIRLNGALRALEQRIEQLQVKNPTGLNNIADYIFSNVQWVNNVMPEGMDLNRLFTTTNTSGIQLEQTDILKSLLLKRISKDKVRYETIWQACEHMENYFESNVRQLFISTSWQDTTPDQLAQFDSNLFKHNKYDDPDNSDGMSIAELAIMPDPSNKSDTDNVNISVFDDEMVHCSSIISFPLLLLHTYRIFSKQQESQQDITVRLHADRLIDSFAQLLSSTEMEIKGFFECLWKVRYQFDLWVVKWVYQDERDEKRLQLTSVVPRQSNGKWYRSHREMSDLVLLQSVRYFTGERSAQYWLTPFLGWLIKSKTSDMNLVVKELERIDNQLSLTGTTQKVASFELLSGDLSTLKFIDDVILNYLSLPLGTSFEHYWFQKLEYLLWKHSDTFFSKDSKFIQYRITSKNSIEHVHPQNGERGIKLDKENLDAFW